MSTTMPDASVITNLDFECLPSVIAIPLPDLARETHPVIQLWRVCDTYEQILRPVVAIGAAELDTRGGLSDEVAKGVSTRIERPTCVFRTHSIEVSGDPVAGSGGPDRGASMG